MAKDMWVNNPNYVRKVSVASVVSDWDQFKKQAEIRMALYDAQPKLVRQCVNEFGALSSVKGHRSTKDKCKAIRDARKRFNERNSVLLTD